VPLIRRTQWLDATLPTASRDSASRQPKLTLRQKSRPRLAPVAPDYPKGVPRTGLWQQSNQSPLPGNGNWKKASRDRRPKPAPKGPNCRGGECYWRKPTQVTFIPRLDAAACACVSRMRGSGGARRQKDGDGFLSPRVGFRQRAPRRRHARVTQHAYLEPVSGNSRTSLRRPS
jgi:hypothetical protein